MPINFPSSPSNNQLFVTEGKAMRYNATKNRWKAVSTLSSSQITDLEARTIGVSSMSISGNTLVIQKDDSSYANVSLASFAGNKLTTYANASILPLNDLVSGTQVYVEDTDSLYITDGSGWYKIATVNLSPSLTLGVSSISLGAGGSVDVNYTVNEPEDTPYTVSASSTSNATITVYQANNTITFNSPVQNTTETITITATDGVNSVGDTLTMSIALFISNSKYTTLLATAVDTSNNSTITDSSSNARSVTIAGSPDIGTFSPYRHGGYSTYFDKTGSYVQSDIAATGTNNFTYECWVYPTDLSDYGSIFTSGAAVGITGVIVGGDQWWVGHAGEIYQFVSGNQFTLNTWQHVAVVRQGNTVTGYVDGTSVGSATISVSIPSTLVRLGHRYTDSTTYAMKGYIRDFRLVNSAVYTSNFTPPTETLTSISGTELLVCSLPYLKDQSTNDHSLTVTGSITTEAFSPYDHSGYSASDNGGSIKFDGVYGSDTLRVSEIDFGTGDFCVEGWFYSPTATDSIVASGQTISGGEGDNVQLLRFYKDGVVGFTAYFQDGYIFNSVQSDAMAPGQWFHCAITRSYQTVRVFINGEQLAENSASSDIEHPARLNSIGFTMLGAMDYGATPYQNYNGYVSDFKVTAGSAVYTSNFTPPTSLTSSSGADLHFKGTDASIIDKSQASNIQIIGNTTGSTTQAKFTDTKSMYFDGNGDAIEVPESSFPAIGSSDFTIEAWARASSLASSMALLDCRPSGTSSGVYITLQWHTTNGIGLYVNGWRITNSSSALTVNTWHHIALCRSDSSTKLFVDGTQVGSTYSDSNSYLYGRNYIGGLYNNTNSWWNGYIQDFRVSIGLARYTSNFTPPTSSLEG